METSYFRPPELKGIGTSSLRRRRWGYQKFATMLRRTPSKRTDFLCGQLTEAADAIEAELERRAQTALREEEALP